MTTTYDGFAPARRASDRGPPEPYATATEADSGDYSEPPVRLRPVQGRDTALVIVPQLGAENRTCRVEVAIYAHGQIPPAVAFLAVAGVFDVTATRKVAAEPEAWVPSEPIVCPLYGAAYYDVRVTEISSGSVALTAWTLGAGGAAAEASS
ncbi:MAG: hypothetical protein KIT58_00155 [Planctomycetota bacterium]|nr:hypothetical protein [Planctomycetota bacterium]